MKYILLTKVMYLFGKGLSPNEVRAEMQHALAGEITIG